MEELSLLQEPVVRTPISANRWISSNLTHLCRCKIQEELLSECETIQSRMTNEKTKRLNTEETARRFAKFNYAGKI